jgi:glucose-1-phosphate thymidylyltransferase
MKGIILAAGRATRLYPITKGICKHLFPVYNKPMIYYPLSTLMLAGIRDILIITTPQDRGNFYNLMGDGSHVGINISYVIQEKPAGIAQAFLLGEKFIGKDNISLILGDNIFYGDRLSHLLQEAPARKKGATIFVYQVADPQRYGVATFDRRMKVTSLMEKPDRPRSDWAVTGLYFYDNNVIDIARKLKPSSRGELEITDINKVYLKRNDLRVQTLGRGFAWLDTGTYNSLIDASLFIKTIEERQGFMIGSVEEIAWRMGFITARQLYRLGAKVRTSYGHYLQRIAKHG